MTAITLELNDENDLDLLIGFANRINAKITNLNTKSELINPSPIDILDKIAQNGGISYFPEPSLWQSEIWQYEN